ncbi:MAG: SDR family NAD(P)-dependent oxidoreductase [Candidatus Nanopelagicales bacterium]|jgi:3-hydroxybutyrate dehydrogenase
MTATGSLAGRTALVTGGLGGIGRAVAHALAGQGVRLVLHDRALTADADDLLAGLVSAGAPDVRLVCFDLADAASARSGFDAVARRDDVDILVCSAGIQRTAPLAAHSRETWDAVIAVNLSSVFDAMQAFLPSMAERGYGRVVSIASVHGLVASVDKAPYVAAKHGLVGLTKAAALEYATAGSEGSGGVTVNAVCPGWVRTDLIEPQVAALAVANGGDHEAAAADLLRLKQPSLRFTTPADVGALVCLLASPALHNLTGAAIPLDGGWVAA